MLGKGCHVPAWADDSFHARQTWCILEAEKLEKAVSDLMLNRQGVRDSAIRPPMRSLLLQLR